MRRVIVSRILLTPLLISMASFVFITQVERSEPPQTEWTRTYGGTKSEFAYSVVQTSDGGYAIAGGTYYGLGSGDFWLVKTDSSGNMQWNKTYGGLGWDYAESLVQTEDGGYALAGWTNSFGAGRDDFWLVKTDPTGNMLWNKTYGGTQVDHAHSVVQASDGGYAIAGSGFANLVKTDSEGNMLWTQTYNGSPSSMVETSDRGFALAGTSEDYDSWLLKTNSNGVMEWSRTYGGELIEWGGSVVQTVDGGYAIASATFSFGVRDWSFWLVKTDAAGSMQWNKICGLSGYDAAPVAVQTHDGGYAITGVTLYHDLNVLLVKTNAAGNVQWNKTEGGTNARDLIQTRDGGYAITGGSSDFWLIKIAPELGPMVPVTLDIKPDRLKLRSRGKWVTAYVELPEIYDASDIDVSTILLENAVPVGPDAPTEIGDFDEDGIPDLMVKFDRAEVIELLISLPLGDETTLGITGEVNGMPFEGFDTIQLLRG